MALRTNASVASNYNAGNAWGTDLQQMVSAAQYVEHVGEVMRSEVNGMFNALAVLNPQTWAGEAYVAYTQASAQWQAAQQRLNKALADIAAGLRTSSARYQQADQDAADGINRAASGLRF